MVSSVLHSRKDLMLLSESTQQVCAAFSFYNPNFLPGWAHTEGFPLCYNKCAQLFLSTILIPLCFTLGRI